MQPPGGPLRWRGSCCTCRRCMPPRRAGAARVTMEVLRPMLPVIIQSLNNDARKECTRSAARLLALLAQGWPEAGDELTKLGAMRELVAVYFALEEKIRRTATGALHHVLQEEAISNPRRERRDARRPILGFVFDLTFDADDGDEPDCPDLGLAGFPCISDCDNSEVEKDPWAMAIRPGDGNLLPVGRCSTLRAVCRAICALTGATSAFEVLSSLERVPPPVEQPPTSCRSARAPSAPVHAATKQADMEDMERRRLAAQRAADSLLAEEEREAAQRSKKAGSTAKAAAAGKKKPQTGKTKAAGAAAAAPPARPQRSDDGDVDGDDEAEPSAQGDDDDTSLAAAMQRTGVTVKAPPSLFHAAQMEGHTQQPGAASTAPQPPPARSRPLADALGAAAAAGASQLAVAEAEEMREGVHPPVTQRPAPVAPVMDAAPTGAEALAVTQLFPWMTISPSVTEPAAAMRPAHDDESCCVVCMDAPRTVVLGHRCAHPPVLCSPCAAVLMAKEQALCPVCRASA